MAVSVPVTPTSLAYISYGTRLGTSKTSGSLIKMCRQSAAAGQPRYIRWREASLEQFLDTAGHKITVAPFGQSRRNGDSKAAYVCDPRLLGTVDDASREDSSRCRFRALVMMLLSIS